MTSPPQTIVRLAECLEHELARDGRSSMFHSSVELLNGMWHIAVIDDSDGALGRVPVDVGVESELLLCDLLSQMQDVLMDELQDAWPHCCSGHAHPPVVVVDVDRMARWKCPVLSRPIRQVGRDPGLDSPC